MNVSLPLRGALAWILCRDARVLPYILDHQEFDAPRVLISHIADLMIANGCFPSTATPEAHPSPKYKVSDTVANYEGSFRKLLDGLEGELHHSANGFVDLREFLEDQLSIALKAILKQISAGKLKAKGVPIDDGRPGAAMLVEPISITEEMTLNHHGLLHETRCQNGRAWRLVMLDKDYFQNAFVHASAGKRQSDEIEDDSFFPTPPHAAKKRGPKESVSPVVIRAMETDINSKRMTLDELAASKEEAMASRYDCSRDTARKCRDKVLAALNYRQLATSDN